MEAGAPSRQLRPGPRQVVGAAGGLLWQDGQNMGSHGASAWPLLSLEILSGMKCVACSM